MIDEILPAIIVIALFIAVAAIIVISIAFLLGVGWNLANGEIDTNGNIVPNKPPELKCLYYSDGKTAVVRVFPCEGYEQTIGWLVRQGYHIDRISNPDGWNVNEMFLTR